MKWMARTITVFLLAVLASAASQTGARASKLTDEPKVSAEILAEVRTYYTDMTRRDWNAYSGHFWPGATISTIWQPSGEKAPRVFTQTIPEFVAQAPQGPGSKPIFEEKMTGAKVRATGRLAQVWARYEAKFGEAGALESWSGTDAFTLLKHEGRWKIVCLAFAAER